MTKEIVFNRLEDFISLAKKGKKFGLTVILNKHIFLRKFEPYTMGDSDDEVAMYILSADYLFDVGGEVKEVTKYYVSGIEGESQSMTRLNIDIANKRLKVDYRRLSDVNIIFEKKYFS
jgi:hypothetical protein